MRPTTVPRSTMRGEGGGASNNGAANAPFTAQLSKLGRPGANKNVITVDKSAQCVAGPAVHSSTHAREKSD